RRAAVEILNTCKDKRAIDHLIAAIDDKDWWVSERAADALAEIGDPKALPAVLKMLARNDRSIPVALRAVGKLGDEKALGHVLPYLRRPEREVKLAAIEAIAELAGEQHAAKIREFLQQTAASSDESIARAANRALQRIEG